MKFFFPLIINSVQNSRSTSSVHVSVTDYTKSTLQHAPIKMTQVPHMEFFFGLKTA